MKEIKKPFFAKFLETQKVQEEKDVKGGIGLTRKFPSDNDEYEYTMKAPSDNDEI